MKDECVRWPNFTQETVPGRWCMCACMCGGVSVWVCWCIPLISALLLFLPSTVVFLLRPDTSQNNVLYYSYSPFWCPMPLKVRCLTAWLLYLTQRLFSPYCFWCFLLQLTKTTGKFEEHVFLMLYEWQMSYDISERKESTRISEREREYHKYLMIKV